MTNLVIGLKIVATYFFERVSRLYYRKRTVGSLVNSLQQALAEEMPVSSCTNTKSPSCQL